MTPIVEVYKSQCPKCGSTERTEYNNTRAPLVVGGLKDGRRYTSIIWRRTTCKSCKQARIDKCYEFLTTNTPDPGQPVNRDNNTEKPTQKRNTKKLKAKKKPN